MDLVAQVLPDYPCYRSEMEAKRLRLPDVPLQIRHWPHLHFFDCAGKTSLENISVGEYAKLDDKENRWGF